MPSGLKNELGLGEPSSPNSEGSTEQADKFRADFQAAAAPINEALQYTSAHAEQDKHNAQSGKRDTTCTAYQTALGRIDPTNPAVAQGAIDQVLAAVQSLASAVQSFKEAVQRAFDAWTAREGELDDLVDKVREMVEWGHEKAAALQQIIDSITEKANCRKWEEALQALEQLIQKFTAIWEEYCRQKAAQEQYEPALAALEPNLAETATCEFQSLEGKSQEISALADEMRQAAQCKDYVKALELLRQLEQLVTEYLSEFERLRALKEQYEQIRAELDPKLAEASTCEFQSLAELDQQIADMTAQMEEAASAEEYERALDVANQLASKVDEKIQRAEEIRAAKEQYEQIRAELDPKLAEASTCEFQSLAELDQQIADMTAQMEEAASAEEYERALDIANQLASKVDEKIQRAEEIRAAKEQYEQGRAELEPRLGEASTSEYEQLAELDQEIANLTTQMDEAAAADEFESANDVLGELSGKVDEKLRRVEEIEAAREQYETARSELDPRLAEASTSEHQALAELDQQIADLTGQVDQAADAQDYEQALELCNQLSQKVDEKLQRVEEIEAAKQEYETARAALDPRLAEASECLYPSLEPLTQEIATVQGEMEAAAEAEDWEKARDHCSDLTGKVDGYLQAKQDLEQQYQDKLGSAQSAVEQLKSHGQSSHFTAEIGNAETQLAQAKSQGDGNQLQAAIDALNQVISLCSETLTTMQLIDEGLARARAEEVADVSQELIDTGVDRAKALEVGRIMQSGGTGTVEDSKLVAADVAQLPMDVIEGMRANGTEIVACRDSVADYAPDLLAEPPRGWKPGSTMHQVPGIFDPERNQAIISTSGHGTPGGAHVSTNHGSNDLVAHEVMHGYDHNGGGTPHHDEEDFVNARAADYDKLGRDYYKQDGIAGLQETYAESAARYYNGDPTLKTEWPHLYEYWHNRGASSGSGTDGSRGSGHAETGAGGGHGH